MGLDKKFDTSLIFEASKHQMVLKKQYLLEGPSCPPKLWRRTSGLNADYIMSGDDRTNPTQNSAMQIIFVKYRAWK